VHPTPLVIEILLYTPTSPSTHHPTQHRTLRTFFFEFIFAQQETYLPSAKPLESRVRRQNK
jgi:hypothetical protein